MILECDIGNTACKWRVINKDGDILDRGWLKHAEQGFEVFKAIYELSRVKVVSVAGEAVNSRLSAEIERNHSLSVEWAKTSNEVAGVTNAYRNAGGLGVDRWAGLVAAYQIIKGPLLVVDAGSAITVDVVGGDGCHQGGYIVPGLSLMKSALLKDTQGVRLANERQVKGIHFGVSTDQAVHSGVRAAMLGVVLAARSEVERLYPKGYSFLLTGGDGKQLLNYFDDASWQPDLVLDGLKWLLP